MKWVSLEIISRTVILFIIGFIFIYLIYSMTIFGGRYSEKQASSIEKIIDKALVQCYAMEGSYPGDIEYIEKYGVIFDNDKYIYHYEWYGGNLKPTVKVIKK